MNKILTDKWEDTNFHIFNIKFFNLFIMVKYTSILFFLITISCGVKNHPILDDKITVVPINNKIFKNKNLFDKSLLKLIDTTAIYIEDYNYQSSEKDFKNVNNKVYHTRNYHNVCYKFYGNGCFNSFSTYGADYFNSVSTEDVNPIKTGNRGVFYKKNNQIQMDEFGVVGYNLFSKEYGINTSIIEIKGDTLFKKSKFDMKTVTVYLQKKLPKEFLIYKSEW